MSKYIFVVNATISMHVEVEAESLQEALEEAQTRGMMGLCHQCSRGDEGCWNTSGEIDADPVYSPLVEVIADGEVLEGKNLRTTKKIWKGL